MQHTRDEVKRAARRFEQLADELDPDTAQADHTDDLRQVATISEALRAGEAQLRESVNNARARQHDNDSLTKHPPNQSR